MNANGVGADTLIILSRDQANFFEFLKPRQPSSGGTLVILDRREGERRRDGHDSKNPPADADAAERRQRDRRQPTPEAALALMSVLGFMILHRDGDRWVP